MTSHQDCANAIRILTMDAVQKANSGHPGMPMGMADIAETLWRDVLQFNPKNPKWFNRDRFILSNGHGAMLLYALLHLTGFDLSLDDIKQFRQLHSKTPGHPEYRQTPGVETTTGPLGQGLANGVGMALGEKLLAQHFNRDGFPIVDHMTYVFAGDGCFMEGISHEACSLAGTLGLGKLIVFWDNNGISIDGDVTDWFTDNIPRHFESYNWHVVDDVNGHDHDSIFEAIQSARIMSDKPSLICCKTIIGFGAPNVSGSAKSHGAPLGEAEISLTRKALHWEHPPFVIPDAIYQSFDAREKGKMLEDRWNTLFSRYERVYPRLASEFLRRKNNYLPDNFEKKSMHFIRTQQDSARRNNATRKDSLACLNHYAPNFPELIGGSADLSSSNCTEWSGANRFRKTNFAANYIEYGVREFGMSAIMNGLALYGGFIPYGGTFLVFSDYARNALRLSALMQTHVIYVYTHDSIGVGEDGPTHQPIEHNTILRVTPGLNVWRPADGVETAVAWRESLKHQGPSCLLLSRQNLAHQGRDKTTLSNISKGGYVLFEQENTQLDAIIIATGSEIDLAVCAAKQLFQKHAMNIRVVSMPCCEIFKKQPKVYREQVLPKSVTKRLAVEAGSPDYWYQFVGSEGIVLGIDRFGASAPAKDLFKVYGFDLGNVVLELKKLLALK